jgi:hypothetical protein
MAMVAGSFWWIYFMVEFRFPAKNEAEIQMDCGAKQRSNWKVFEFWREAKIQIRFPPYLCLPAAGPAGRRTFTFQYQQSNQNRDNDDGTCPSSTTMLSKSSILLKSF